jgi:hypothetical protein
MQTLRLFERVTILVMAVLLVATLVGCLGQEIQLVAVSNRAPVASVHPPNTNAAL